MDTLKNVVTRFAPSPTGSLHIGGIRNALHPYAMAKRYGGKFILRIEDTDQKRLVEGAEQEIQDMLAVYGLVPDEVIHQSDRLPIYKEYAEKLIESGDAYYCFASSEEIAEARKLAQENGENFKYRSPFRDLPLAEARKKIAAGEKAVIRQRLNDNEIVKFSDPVQGEMEFNTNDLDEGVLLKTDGFPTYHLAVVVDDHLMEVTHVFRGTEWIPSVPKHVLLFKAFGWEMPVICHTSLILDPAGGKLSKRKGAVAAKEFITGGYLPEAMLNFLMLLGWSSPLAHEHGEKERELFTLQDFIEIFDIKNLINHSQVFNREKLIWFNQKYIQALTADEFGNRVSLWLQLVLKEKPELEELQEWIINIGPDKFQKVLELERTRISTLAEIPEALDFYYKAMPKIGFSDIKQTKKLTPEQIKKVLTDFAAEAETKNAELTDWSHEEWETFVRALSEQMGIKAGEAFMVLRIAVTSKPNTPPLYEVMQILGRDEVVARLKNYV